MAHCDIDEEEAQAMGLLSRLHIFANEAMQIICSAKPKYDYFEATVVPKYIPLVTDGKNLRQATKEEAEWDEELQGPLFNEEGDRLYFATEDILRDYYHKQNIYEVCEIISMDYTFIGFANKQVWREYEHRPTLQEIFEWEAFGDSRFAPKPRICRERINLDHDMSYIGKNRLKFYKPGKYYVPCKYLWYVFESGQDDFTEIDMPSDIFLTIPLYIASICLQIDSPQRANLKRTEFESALARCSSADFMELNEIKGSW